jgi:hypothetical protein
MTESEKPKVANVVAPPYRKEWGLKVFEEKPKEIAISLIAAPTSLGLKDWFPKEQNGATSLENPAINAQSKRILQMQISADGVGFEESTFPKPRESFFAERTKTVTSNTEEKARPKTLRALNLPLGV